MLSAYAFINLDGLIIRLEIILCFAIFHRLTFDKKMFL